MFVTKLVFLEVLGFVKGVLRGKMFFLFFFVGGGGGAVGRGVH